MTARRVFALVVGLAAVLGLSACGVRPSGVVEAGSPATGMRSGVTVYFLSDGTLVGVPRAGAVGDVAAAVRLLFAGPTEAEAGVFRTDLPRLSGSVAVRTDGAGIVVRLPGEVAPLGDTALAQVVCTAVAAADRAPRTAARSAPRTVPPSALPIVPSSPRPTLPEPARAGVTVRVTADGWVSTAERADACPPA